jgi:hypothetical protein
MQRNNYFFGFLLGIIIPFLGFVLVYMLRYMLKGVTVEYFIQLLQDVPRAVSSTISLGLITCIPLFTYYRSRKLYKTLYGIFAAVAIYALIVMQYRFNII